MFFETLLDENAASHIALGNGYELTVHRSGRDGGGSPRSKIHADLMIGSAELDVDGITDGGEPYRCSARALQIGAREQGS